MRDNKWLRDRLIQIWQRHFADITPKNEVIIRFGRAARTRLGSIKYGPGSPSAKPWSRFGHRGSAVAQQPGIRGQLKAGRERKEHPRTYITITGYFRDPAIPEFVVDTVLAHELAHYCHGFYSPHQKLYHYPHKHGVINRELTRRGLGDILKKQKRWLKENWRNYLKHESD